MSRNQISVFRRFFSSRLFLAVAFVSLVLIALGYARAYYQDYQIRQEIRELEDEVKSLETRKIESMELLRYVSSPDFVEEKARTELNLTKPGEKVIIIQRERKEGADEPNGLGTDRPLNNIVQWWYYFTHNS